MAKINLPCLRGRIGEWTYFSTVMKIKDIVEGNRIITVAESELYTENINRVLQREINKKRISQISKYLLENDEHFFSSIIVGIHKGNPEWSDVSINSLFSIKGEKLDDESLSFIENKFGILTLSGEEEIFALDGQHRLKGLRDAFRKNNEIGEEEISLVYVIHDDSYIEKTRRLFTVLNKYAEKPKEAELIILEEDDVAAINSRRLITEHQHLSKQNSLSDTKTGNISANDFDSFTTLVTVYRINKVLYNKRNSFYTVRPTDEDIEEYYQLSKSFWDFLFEVFPEIARFIDGERNIFLNEDLFDRNPNSGGSLILRPVGQHFIAKTYKHFMDSNNLDYLKENIRKIDFNLSGDTLNYIFWNNGRMVPKELRLKERLFLHLLGDLNIDNYDIQGRIKEIYENYNEDYYNHIVPVTD
ncbi:DNA sulfur modification protein DndB [Kordia algicida OT-1]|uniref:DGQHR domain-containing protein n=1 Tax=Kordia algicida OT-1 TaxID=391587 RepID=A9DP81_9FLAO|nr:DNA sulfur modification protein DndB [Kordia algicida]EDP97374.1 hypothetical protein KAOT1_19467 [Kordia algicida OT-1]